MRVSAESRPDVIHRTSCRRERAEGPAPSTARSGPPPAGTAPASFPPEIGLPPYVRCRRSTTGIAIAGTLLLAMTGLGSRRLGRVHDRSEG